MSDAKFTAKQISNWRDYERVRQSGLFNMYSPDAREMTDMTKEEYVFCMKNYSELKECATSKSEQPK